METLKLYRTNLEELEIITKITCKQKRKALKYKIAKTRL